LLQEADQLRHRIFDDADLVIAALALASIEAELVDLARSLHVGRSSTRSETA
jgi:hypothetical protein